MLTQQNVWKHWGVTISARGKVTDPEMLHNPSKTRFYCFACGADHLPIKKEVIVPLDRGTFDNVEDIHLLCSSCREASRPFVGQEYWRWFDSVNYRSPLEHMLNLAGYDTTDKWTSALSNPSTVSGALYTLHEVCEHMFYAQMDAFTEVAFNPIYGDLSTTVFDAIFKNIPWFFTPIASEQPTDQKAGLTGDTVAH